MPSQDIRITPLGGVGEIGKNMIVVELDEDMLVIDAGLMFPGEQMLGVDFVIPDVTYLRENRHRLRGIVLTHGHEDHIGALPYVYEDLEAPVLATRLTHGLIAAKLRERGAAAREWHERFRRCIAPGDRLALGKFQLEFFRVSHSIPDGVGVAIETSEGLIVHSGDFKFDQTPVNQELTDFGRLSDYGRRGVLALLSDCVRVELPGHTPSERVVGETIDDVISKAPGRVIITTFASNISRIQQVFEVAARRGRKVAVVGRSMENNLEVALSLGYLAPQPGILLKLEELTRLPLQETVIVTTGSQGEPTSVLSRIAADEHKSIKVNPGDTVLISATPVPGNEDTVAHTIDNLFRLGANVIYPARMTVHVSGHASREDLKMMINLLHPRYCLPVHGEYRHMVLYRELATEVGLMPSKVLFAELGHTLQLTREEAREVGRVPCGSVLVDGVTVGEVGQEVLRDRLHLARDGVFVVAVAMDRLTGRVVGGPDLLSRGFSENYDADGLLDMAREKVAQALEGAGEGEVEYSFVAKQIRETLGRFLYEKTRRRPMILPVVTEV